MTAVQVSKTEVFKMILGINDSLLIEDIKNFVTEKVQQDTSADWWDDLTTEQQQELEMALAECDDPATTVTYEDVLKDLDLWLTR
jgi:hypothetical protein